MADKIVAVPQDSGSPARVALDLMRCLEELDPKPKNKAEALDIYAECLEAARGERVLKEVGP